MNNAERNAIMSTIEDYLIFMELSVPTEKSAKQRTLRLPLSVFKHAEPFHTDLDTEALSGATRNYYTGERENNPTRWLPRFDIAWLITNDMPEVRFSLRRIRTLSNEEKRGNIKPWTPYAVRSFYALVKSDGEHMTSHTDYGWVGGKWQQVRAQGWDLADDWAEDLHMMGYGAGKFNIMSWAHQIAVYRPLLWHVSIGYDSHVASLLLPCHAGTILDLFKLRELPAGARRRAALLHWVSDHWRSTPTAHDDAVRVAAHLRGQTRFVWKEGLVVQIMPAEEDKRLLKPTAKHALLPSAPR